MDIFVQCWQDVTGIVCKTNDKPNPAKPRIMSQVLGYPVGFV
jgi:hypothetical protein